MPSLNPEVEAVLSKIRDFEFNELDKTLENLPSLSFNGDECIKIASLSIEIAYANSTQHGFATSLRRGLSILAPYFIKSNNSKSPDVDQLLSDLQFGSHYYMLREYLYYTYKCPESFVWSFEEKKVEVLFKDLTIPRQFFITENNFILESVKIYSNYKNSEEIINLLQGEDEFSVSSNTQEALRLIADETALKLSSYYNFMDYTKELKLKNYTYAQFLRIYACLLSKALFHRYYAEANGTAGTIISDIEQLTNVVSQSTSIEPSVCLAIITDMAYSKEYQTQGIQPLYFSLYSLQEHGQIVMMPYDFCMWEGLVSMLRVWALQDPKMFLNNISGHLSDNFLNYVAALFLNQGFACFKNLQLKQFDKSLPDIDLVTVSEIAAFGYVIYFCEVKNPIPPQWAKDQLKALNEDSVKKAFNQLERVKKFLTGDEGRAFLRSLVPEDGLPGFGEQFLISYNFLIITSDNIGTFFSDQTYPVINYRTLENILYKCDGEIAYVTQKIKELGKLIDQNVEIPKIECKVGSKTVIYEGVSTSKLLDFPQNLYKSNGVSSRLAQEFIAEGGHPYDFIPE